MPHNLEDLNRRKITLRTSKVGEVVPEYFEEDNAKFITFLEKYHDHLDSNQTHGFGHIINELIYARDVAQTSEDNLDELIKEIGYFGLIKVIWKLGGIKRKVMFRAFKMKKKWPFKMPEEYLSMKVSDLREMHGIEVLLPEEMNYIPLERAN